MRKLAIIAACSACRVEKGGKPPDPDINSEILTLSVSAYEPKDGKSPEANVSPGLLFSSIQGGEDV